MSGSRPATPRKAVPRWWSISDRHRRGDKGEATLPRKGGVATRSAETERRAAEAAADRTEMADRAGTISAVKAGGDRIIFAVDSKGAVAIIALKMKAAMRKVIEHVSVAGVWSTFIASARTTPATGGSPRGGRETVGGAINTESGHKN